MPYANRLGLLKMQIPFSVRVGQLVCADWFGDYRSLRFGAATSVAALFNFTQKERGKSMARYCTYCGNEVNENAVVCVKCGCAIPQANNQTGQRFSQTYGKPSVVDVISKRIKTNGIIWIVVALGVLIVVPLAIGRIRKIKHEIDTADIFRR